MIRRIFAILFIFLVTTTAWMILGTTINVRTYSALPGLREKVASSWGSAQEQFPPNATYAVPVEKETTSVIDGRTVKQIVKENQNVEIALDGNQINADLNLEYRQKGLLWYSTYRVVFAGVYQIRNDTDREQIITLRWRYPAQKAIYDDLNISLDGQPLKVTSETSGASAILSMAAGKTVTYRVAYRSQGLDTWSYNFGGEIAQVRNFKLQLTTNFHDIDFPENGLSPTAKQSTPTGWQLAWNYSNLVSGYQIGVSMPAKLQPGPLAGEISYFAPVSLFFFFFVMLLLTTIRGVELHPMNYFFLAAAFFAFHLLLAYLVDHVSIHIAFVIASVVSVTLVISYLRLVIGTRFALFEAGVAQFVFLVLFSYAFFFKGYTGLAITIGAVLTLFAAMQLTGRVRWSERFGRAQPVAG